jgi:hypothetical protein
MAAGKKTGGRKKGSVNKATVAKQLGHEKVVAKAQATGLSPLEIMLDNARHYYRLAMDAEQLLAGKTAAEIIGSNADMTAEDQIQVILAEARKCADLRDRSQACARDAAPYLHSRLAPQEAGKRADEVVPLADRLKEYQRRDQIAASEGKVVALKRGSA